MPAAMMLALTACDNKESKPVDTNTGTTPTTNTNTGTGGQKLGHFSEPVEITFKSTFSFDDTINGLIDKFQEVEPNVTVTYEKLSGTYSTLKTNVIEGIGANNLPNLVSCYPDHVAEYLDYDIVVNLEKYMNSSEDYAWTQNDYDDVLPSLLSQCNNFARTGTFMLPHSSSTEAMFYNASILGRRYEGCNDGNPIDAEYLNDITWEEFMGKLCPAIKKFNADNGNCFFDASETGKGAICAYSGADNAFVTLCEETGTTFSSIDKSTGEGQINFNDTRTMKDVMKQFHQYHEDGLFTTATLEGENNLNVNEKHWAVFATGSTGGIKYQVPSDASFTTGVMRIPNFEGKDHKVISQGPGLAVLKSGDENKDLASYLFINFINSTRNTLKWALETGYFPVRYSAYELDDYVDACDSNGKQDGTLDLLKAKTYTYASTVQDDFFTNAAFKGSDNARTLAGTLLNDCVGYKGELTDEILNQKFSTCVNDIKKKL